MERLEGVLFCSVASIALISLLERKDPLPTVVCTSVHHVTRNPDSIMQVLTVGRRSL